MLVFTTKRTQYKQEKIHEHKLSWDKKTNDCWTKTDANSYRRRVWEPTVISWAGSSSSRALFCCLGRNIGAVSNAHAALLRLLAVSCQDEYQIRQPFTISETTSYHRREDVLKIIPQNLRSTVLQMVLHFTVCLNLSQQRWSRRDIQHWIRS